MWIATTISLIRVQWRGAKHKALPLHTGLPKVSRVDAFTVARTVLFSPQHHDHIPLSLDRIDNSYLLLCFALDWTAPLKSAAQ